MTRKVKSMTILLLAVASAFADEGEETKKPKKDPYRVARREVARIKSTIKHKGETKTLPLLDGPIYSYHETIRGWARGSTWAWGHPDRARPAALMNMSGANTIYYEYASLSNDSFEITTGYDSPSFRPVEKGWAPKPIPTKMKPAESRVRRMAQIRSLSRKFTAHQTDFENDDRENVLRMLSSPIYRYKKDDAQSLDGAIFAFIREGDLEVILTIEAEKTPTGPRWVFDCDRVAIFGQQVKFDGNEVWSTPAIGVSDATSSKNYFIFTRRPLPDEFKPATTNSSASIN